MSLIYFEDYEIGEKFRSDTYVVDKDELVEFAKKWDPQPFHIDEDAAKSSIYSGLTAPTAYIFAVASYLANTIKPQAAVLGALGLTDLEFPNPMRPGDRITGLWTVVEKRESTTRSDRGVVQFSIRVVNQNDDLIATYGIKLMVARRLDSNDTP